MRASLCRIPRAPCPASLPTGDFRKILLGAQIPGPSLSPLSTQGAGVLNVYNVSAEKPGQNEAQRQEAHEYFLWQI